MRTVAIVNQKGGSGKTTTAINLSSVLASRGQRVLLVDLDPQGHCALGLAIPDSEIDQHIGDAMISIGSRQLDPDRFTWHVSRNLDLIPSAATLAGLEAARGGLADREHRDLRLRMVLDAHATNYDWCIVDCSPSIGLLTFNAMRAATEILIPVETSYFALQGAGRQVSAIEALGRRFGQETPYRVLPTLHDPDSPLASDVLGELQQRFESSIIPVVIRLDQQLREAASFGLPIVEYAPRSLGSADYGALASWIHENPVMPRMVPVDDEMLIAEPPPVVQPIAEPACHTSAPPAEPTVAHVHSETPARAELGALAPAESSPVDRAAELAARARQLAVKGEQIETRLRRDPHVARVMEELDATPPPRKSIGSLKPEVRRLLGVRNCGSGVLFVQPGGPEDRYAIAGDHNGWEPSRSPMRYNADLGVHELHVALPPGRFSYRIVIDGQWINDPFNPMTEPNPYGSVNSIVVVPNRDLTIKSH